MNGACGWAVCALTVTLLMETGMSGCQTDQKRKQAERRQAHAEVAKSRGEDSATTAAAAIQTADAQFSDSLEAEAVAHCPPQPIAFARNKWTQRPLRVRCYVGRVGTEPAMALFTWQHPDSIGGSFVLLRGGAEYTVKFAQKPSRPIELTVVREYPDYNLHGTWQLTGQPGTTIAGTWVEGAVRKKVLLHEDYTDAVRCEILTLHLTGGRPESGGVPGFRCSIPSWSQDYLHLLENVAQRPALRQLQCPPEQVRRRQLLREYERAGEGGRSIIVRLNGFGLLSYALWYSEMPFGGQRQDGLDSRLVDLRTGRELILDSLLNKGYQTALRRLIANHLLHDGNFDRMNKPRPRSDNPYVQNEVGGSWIWKTASGRELLADGRADDYWVQRDVAPSPGCLLFSSEGLEATYSANTLTEGGLDPYVTVLIPYAELRPLVRPGTPLARMLAARGLW